MVAAAAASVVEATLKDIVMVFSKEMGYACTFLVVRDPLGYSGAVSTALLLGG